MSIVRSAVRSPVRSPVRSVLGGGDTQTDLSRLLALSPSLVIWPANGAGWQGTSGGTLAASGQPLGLGADLSQLGGKTLDQWLAAPTTSELVTNGGFDANVTGWTTQLGASIAWSSGEIEITSSSTNNNGVFQTIMGLTVGRLYVSTAIVRRGTCADVVRFGVNGIGDQLTNSTTNVALTYMFRATSTSHNIQVVIGGTSSNGQTAYADNISVRELPGNHLRAGTWASPSDAARGTFQNDAISFSGVDDYYSQLNAISITESMTVVRAFKRASAGIQSIGLGASAASEPREATWTTTNNLTIGLGATAAGAAGGTGTGSFVTTARRNATTETIRRNGADFYSRAAPTVSGSLDVFGRLNTTYNSGEISFEAVFLNTELTGADLALVEQIAAGTNGATLP